MEPLKTQLQTLLQVLALASKFLRNRVEHKLKKTITIKMHEDPAFYGSLEDRIKAIIEDYNAQRITDVERLKLFAAVRETMCGGQSESAETLGLNANSFAIYGMLYAKFKSREVTQEGIVDLAAVIFETLEGEAVLDWINKEDVS